MHRLLIFAAMLGIALGLTTPAHSQVGEGIWQPSQFVGDGWWQSLAVDRMGTAHIGWYGITNGDDALHYRAYHADQTWTDLRDIVYMNIAGFTVRNSLAVSSEGTLGALYRNGTEHYFAKAYAPIADSAANWSPPTQVSTFAYYGDLIVDTDDVWHAAYGEHLGDVTLQNTNPEFEPCFQCSDVLYRRSTDEGRSWSLPVNVSNSPYGSDKIDIWQGESGRLYINWDEGYDGFQSRGASMDVRFAYSEDNGATWSEPSILDGGNISDKRPIQLAMTELDDGESLLAVWRYNGNIDANVYYQLSDDVGATWTQPQAIPGIFARDLADTPFDDYELLSDKQGIVHLFLSGRIDLSSATTIYHLEYRQNQWRPANLIYQNPPNVLSEWPRAAVGIGNELHLTWFTRNRNRGGQVDLPELAVHYTYRTGNLSNPPTPGFQPTLTPIPTEIRVQNFEPTVTPFPTVLPIDEANTSTTSDLYAIETLLAAAFVALIFCGVVLLASGFRPRR